MPRNGSGSYSLPEAPFVPLTTISSAAMNNDLSDIATAITGSLARDGQGGMTDVLPLNVGGFCYTNDTNTGMYRTGSDAQAIKCGGADIVAVTSAGVDVTGAIKQNGVSILPVGLGPLPWSGTNAPSGWVLAYGQSLSRTTYSALWAFAQSEIALGNTLYTNGDGTTTFTVPDLRGRFPGGKDNMGGVAANRLTNVVMTPNGNTIGAVGGVQSVTIAQTNLPNLNFTVTIPSGQGSHTHSLSPTNSLVGGPGSFGFGSGTNAGQYSIVPIAATLPAMSGTAASGGSGTDLGNVPPAIITTYIIFAGV